MFLTTLSALLAIHTLLGVKRTEMDVTTNSLRVNFLVESALVAGDAYALATFDADYTLAYRVPFIVLTSINILMIVFTIYRLGLYKQFFCFIAGEWHKNPHQSISMRRLSMKLSMVRQPSELDSFTV